MSFKAKLLSFVVLLVLILSGRLYIAALETDNWRGFFYSLSHVIIVAVGTYFAIKDYKTE